jgi:hypothetical protein
MRTLRRVFEPAISLPSLWAAWHQFLSGKRNRPSVRAFEVDAVERIVRLHQCLQEGGYRPGGFRLLLLREPKRRLIAAAPVVDRVAHHAVVRALAPALDRRLIATTYACLEDRGSHRAVLAFLAALRCHRFVLCLDIRHYFLSIDRRRLLEIMGRAIRDERMLGLLATIADSGEGLYTSPGVAEMLGLPPSFPPPGCGLPIGNLTSQWWGNHYLSGADHFIKRQLRIPGYQRYMDDLTLFADSRSQLVEARTELAEWLWEERRLRLKHPSAPVRSALSRFRYLGYQLTRAGIDPTADLLRRMRQKVGAALLATEDGKVERSLASYGGVLGFGLSGRPEGGDDRDDGKWRKE